MWSDTSRLAGSDEERTLARLRGLRSDLIDPAIAAHHGRTVKRTGDGSLVEFRGVVDATRFTIRVPSSASIRRAVRNAADRPALQRLLQDVRAGKIDVIVVYKIRLPSLRLYSFAAPRRPDRRGVIQELAPGARLARAS
jgi:class 3 adenylate cyclase